MNTDELMFAAMADLQNAISTIADKYVQQFSEAGLNLNDLMYCVGSSTSSVVYNCIMGDPTELVTPSDDQAAMMAHQISNVVDGYMSKIALFSEQSDSLVCISPDTQLNKLH